MVLHGLQRTNERLIRCKLTARGSVREEDIVQTIVISHRKLAVVLGGVAILTVPCAVLMLIDESYFESWERARTVEREVSWMQEPVLHKVKKLLNGWVVPQNAK